MAAAVWENRSRAGWPSDWQACQPGASRKQAARVELKTMTVLCLCYCARRAAHTWPHQRTDWLSEWVSELAGNLCEQVEPRTRRTGISPRLPRLGGRGQMVAARLWAQLRKESERKGGEGVQRRARGREARRGQRGRDMRRYGAGSSGSTTTTTTTEDSPESLREVGTPADSTAAPCCSFFPHTLHRARSLQTNSCCFLVSHPLLLHLVTPTMLLKPLVCHVFDFTCDRSPWMRSITNT